MKAKIWIILIILMIFMIFCTLSNTNYYKDMKSNTETIVDENWSDHFCVSEEKTNKIICVNITKGIIKETTYAKQETFRITVIDSRPVIWIADVKKDDAIVFIEELRREDERFVSQMIDYTNQMNIVSIKPTNYSIDESQSNKYGLVGIYIEF